MSVPEANALSPAPRNTSTLMAGSPLASFADRGKPLVHRESKGVAGLRPVEGDPPDAVLKLENEVFCLCGL